MVLIVPDQSKNLNFQLWLDIMIMGSFIYILDSSNSIQSHFELVSLVLALEATEPVSELVTQMAVELINNHLISVQQKR